MNPNSNWTPTAVPTANLTSLHSIFDYIFNNHRPSLVHITAPTLVVPIDRTALRGKVRVVGLFTAAADPISVTVVVSLLVWSVVSAEETLAHHHPVRDPSVCG
jgi:hypothetical protein